MGFVSKFQDIRMESNTIVYEDNAISTTMYFIDHGDIRLYSENNLTFWSFKKRENFGEVDIFLNQNRNGLARTLTKSKLYYINRLDILNILHENPEIRKEMVLDSFKLNKKMIEKRKKAIS